LTENPLPRCGSTELRRLDLPPPIFYNGLYDQALIERERP